MNVSETDQIQMNEAHKGMPTLKYICYSGNGPSGFPYKWRPHR